MSSKNKGDGSTFPIGGKAGGKAGDGRVGSVERLGVSVGRLFGGLPDFEARLLEDLRRSWRVVIGDDLALCSESRPLSLRLLSLSRLAGLRDLGKVTALQVEVGGYELVIGSTAEAASSLRYMERDLMVRATGVLRDHLGGKGVLLVSFRVISGFDGS